MKMVAFTGGGTGGHIYPGIAVAEEFLSLKNDFEVAWIGSSRGMDRTIVEDAGIKFYGVPSGKLRRYFSLKTITDMFRIVGGFFSSFHRLRKLKPCVLFSKGGFVSVPPCFVAKLLGIPVIIHECDFTPGLANKINSKFATKILLSYEETKKFFSGKFQAKLIVTGNPVRPAFYEGDKKIGLDFLKSVSSDFYQVEESVLKNDLPIILVMGGSLGSRQVNELVQEVLPTLLTKCVVVHQTGNANLDQASFVETLSADLKNRYIPLPYIRAEMPHVLKLADLVISRSGANALWECAVQSKAMLLIPFEGAGTRGDQVDNALFFKQNSAAFVLSNALENPEEKPSAENLKNLLLAVISDKEKLAQLGKNANNLTPEFPAKRIANIIYDVIKSGGEEK